MAGTDWKAMAIGLDWAPTCGQVTGQQVGPRLLDLLVDPNLAGVVGGRPTPHTRPVWRWSLGSSRRYR